MSPSTGAVWLTYYRFGRPVAGQLNFNPSFLDTSQWKYDSQLGTSLHEISHVLGFDNSKFSYFNVDPSSGRSVCWGLECVFLKIGVSNSAQGSAHCAFDVCASCTSLFVCIASRSARLLCASWSLGERNSFTFGVYFTRIGDHCFITIPL